MSEGKGNGFDYSVVIPRLEGRINEAFRKIEYIAEEWNSIFGKGVSRVEGAQITLSAEFKKVVYQVKQMRGELFEVRVKTDHSNKMLEMLITNRGMKVPKLGT